MERVSRIAEVSDGFELAELDLEIRQEGDVLGTSQSGKERQLKLLNLVEDYEIIQRAYDDAAEIVARDIDLARSVTEEMILEEFEYLDKS